VYQHPTPAPGLAQGPTFWAPPRDIPPERAGEIAAWLDRCEEELVHPADVQERLQRVGWPAAPASAAANRYRRRFNEHALGYSALLVSTGLAALAAGTAGHLLTGGLDAPVNRNALAGWLTVLVCALPFAVWAHRWAATIDRVDPVAIWSGPRRTLAGVLLWASGIVGVARLLVYAGQLIGVLVGATWAHGSSVVTGAVNVAITVGIALPLGLWAFGFLHRFDREDPTVPVARRRRAAR
jgi:hypothetical protein